MNPKITQKLEEIKKQEVIPLIERTVTNHLKGSDKCDICGCDLTRTPAGEFVCNNQVFTEQPSTLKAEIGIFVKSDHIETFYHEHDEVRGEFKGDND